MYAGNHRNESDLPLLIVVSFALCLQSLVNLWVFWAIVHAPLPSMTGSLAVIALAICLFLSFILARIILSRLRASRDAGMQRFYDLLRHDALTGALTRTFFLDRIRAEARAGALLVIDVDHFKAVNDEHGHYTGDAALTHIASALAGEIGRDGYFGRLGGEEFAVFFPGAGDATGLERAELLRKAVEASDFEFNGISLAITVSIGISHHGIDTPIGKSLRLADDNLYAAKKSGRNCVSDQANSVLALQQRLKQASAR